MFKQTKNKTFGVTVAVCCHGAMVNAAWVVISSQSGSKSALLPVGGPCTLFHITSHARYAAGISTGDVVVVVVGWW